MISDNFVTGDNVYLNELKNFFFEVLGMMSITHYGAIGDGRYDNYGPLQVAIEDARRRGLCYIYVPYGRFRFRGELQHLDDVTFIGNPRAKIYNDKTGEEIEILQFGVMGCGGTTALTEVLYLVDGTEPTLTTGAYFTGPYGVVVNGNTVIPAGTPFYYDADTQTITWSGGTIQYQDGSWVVNSTASTSARRDVIMVELSNDHILQQTDVPELLEFDRSSTAGNGFTLSNGKVVVGTGINKVLVSANTAWLTDDDYSGEQKIIYLQKNDTSFYFNASNFETTLAQTPMTIQVEPFLIDVEEGDTISLKVAGTAGEKIFNLNSTYMTVEAVGYDNSGPEPGPEEDEMRKLTENVTLTDGTEAPLTEGFYFTGTHSVIVNSTTIFGEGEILYYDADTKQLAGAILQAYYDNGSWYIARNSSIEANLSQSNLKVPTSNAVYNAINT